MTGLRVFTVGHSNHSLEAFLALLAKHGVTATLPPDKEIVLP